MELNPQSSFSHQVLSGWGDKEEPNGIVGTQCCLLQTHPALHSLFTRLWSELFPHLQRDASLTGCWGVKWVIYIQHPHSASYTTTAVCWVLLLLQLLLLPLYAFLPFCLELAAQGYDAWVGRETTGVSIPLVLCCALEDNISAGKRALLVANIDSPCHGIFSSTGATAPGKIANQYNS
jgi:hypothetical protein